MPIARRRMGPPYWRVVTGGERRPTDMVVSCNPRELL